MSVKYFSLTEPNKFFESLIESVICGRYRTVVDRGSIETAIPHSTYLVKSITYAHNDPNKRCLRRDVV